MIKVYGIRVNYKSGISMEFEVVSFSIKRDPRGAVSYNWEVYDETKPHPVLLGADDVESVWQIYASTREPK